MVGGEGHFGLCVCVALFAKTFNKSGELSLTSVCLSEFRAVIFVVSFWSNR